MLAHNISSLFAFHGFLLAINYFSYRWEDSFNFAPRAFSLLLFNVHSQEYAILMAKIFYIIIVLAGLHMLNKYFVSNRITFQHYCLVIITLWAGLFVMSLTNIFLILLILDAISFTLVGAIAISGDDDCPISTGTGLTYFTYSILTSVMGYIGCILVHSCVNSFDVNAVVFM